MWTRITFHFLIAGLFAVPATASEPMDAGTYFHLKKIESEVRNAIEMQRQLQAEIDEAQSAAYQANAALAEIEAEERRRQRAMREAAEAERRAQQDAAWLAAERARRERGRIQTDEWRQKHVGCGGPEYSEALRSTGIEEHRAVAGICVVVDEQAAGEPLGAMVNCPPCR